MWVLVQVCWLKERLCSGEFSRSKQNCIQLFLFPSFSIYKVYQLRGCNYVLFFSCLQKPVFIIYYSPTNISYIFRWHSSLWKLLWKELLVYTISFLAISFVYRFALTPDQQESFGLLVRWCGKMYTGNVDISGNIFSSKCVQDYQSPFFSAFMSPWLWKDGGSSTASCPGQIT